MKICQAKEWEALINGTPDGGVCRLAGKRYQLRRRVVIRGKTDLTVEGDGAEIITEYNNAADFTHSADAFLIEDCHGLTLRGLVFGQGRKPQAVQKAAGARQGG